MTTQPREILFDEAARAKLRNGIDQLADVVGVTLGPSGCNVCMQSWQPTVTKDGNSIVKEVELKDQFENMGAAMGKEVASKVRELCGDGTTTAVLLLRALVSGGVRLIASGASPIGLKRGIDRAVEAVKNALSSASHPVKGAQELLQIATVSAAGNAEYGAVIAQAFEKVGQAGVITIEEAKGTDTVIETVEGMQFDRGYLSPYFCTNLESMVCELADPLVLLVDQKVSSIQELLPLLQGVVASGRELLLVADDLDADVLSTLVVNRLRGALKVVAVKSPGFGDRKKAMLQDLAVLTGATVISQETGTDLRTAGPDVLGSAKRVSITKDKTTLVEGAGSKAAIADRVRTIEAELKLASNSYDKEKLEERKAKLQGGVAVIRVGAATEPELKQKKQIFQDSLNSVRAALEEGVVPGGGVALLRAAEAVGALHLQGDEALGGKLVQQACECCVKQIARNSGHDPSVIVLEIRESPKGYGFNALTDRVENLLEGGVIDAVKVEKTALTVAASAAGVVLLSEALVGDAEESEA
jgi:chaperonin GroEL